MSTIAPAPTPTRVTVYTKRDLVRHLRELGLCDGDTVLARVGFREMGRLERPGDKTLIASFLEAIGPSGTLLALTHSPVQWSLTRDRSYVYAPATAPCVTGRFAEAVVRWEGAYRSQHPTASMAAIGPRADELLADHTHHAPAFAPIKRLIALGGKQLNIGCHFSSPGFGTVHHAYEVLGLATHSLISGLTGCYFRNGNHVSWFRQRDVPGCSLGFHKFYPLYQKKPLVAAGLVGDADSFLIGAAAAFQVEREAIAKAPAAFLCDDPDCFSCRATRLYNWRDMFSYFCRRLPGKMLRRVRKG